MNSLGIEIKPILLGSSIIFILRGITPAPKSKDLYQKTLQGENIFSLPSFKKGKILTLYTYQNSSS